MVGLSVVRGLAMPLLVTALTLNGVAAQESTMAPWLPATAAKLPRWYGFNLLNMFMLGSNNGPFEERDFQLVHELGFNFVRLPLDYRTWIVDGDWEKLDESALQRIDQAVAWGEKYHVHVQLNFHRAPGYTVASPREPKSLWTDAEAQRVCTLHWVTFTKRYRGIPNERLSFNLFNEPAGIADEPYAAVVKPLVEAIRREDPDRLIITDGLQWGTKVVASAKELGLAQATRGYQPMDVTHWYASWVGGADKWPRPSWPRLRGSGTLAAPTKTDLSEAARGPLTIDGPFAAETTLRLHVLDVSAKADLQVLADGQVVFEKSFVCGPGEGEWKKATHKPELNLYQNTYDRDYQATIPAGTKRVEVKVVAGDWLQISQLGLQPAGAAEQVLTLRNDWNRAPLVCRWQPQDATTPFTGPSMENGQWLWNAHVAPFKAAEEQGVGVMVGEFGAYSRTPHDVVLRWMEDCLKNWQKAGWGWALWNLRGSFGIFDSERQDVQYEDYQGLKLDRKMLDLLQQYAK